jgi:DNA-binding transcriptional MerR regulator
MPIKLKIEKKRPTLRKTSKYRKTGYYRISDLVYDFKVTPRTVRVYDDIGILIPLREGEHRYYDQLQYDRMRVALMAQLLGLRLQDIAKCFAEHGDVTLRGIINLLSSHQLVTQRDELMRQRGRMDAVLAEIISALRDREQTLSSAAQAHNSAQTF